MNTTHKICTQNLTDASRIGESRVAWRIDSTSSKPEVPQSSQNLEGLADSLQGQSAKVKKQFEAELGAPLNLDEIVGNEPQELALAGKVAEGWVDTFDKLSGSLGLLLGKPTSKYFFEAVAHTDSVERQWNQDEEEKKNPLPPVAIRIRESTTNVSRGNYNRAKHAADALNRHPEWKKFVDRTATRFGFTRAILASFIEIESAWNPNDTPVYVELATGKLIHAATADGKPEKRLLSKEERARRGLKLYSSAHGLAQVMQYDEPRYIAERYDQLVQERGGTAGLPAKNDPELFYNDEVAIDFMGWHLNNKKNEVASMVITKKYPESYLISGKEPDSNWLYLSYNSGAKGYLAMRSYMDNPTPENYANLTWFQKRDWHKTGVLEGLQRVQTGDKAAQIIRAFEAPLGEALRVA